MPLLKQTLKTAFASCFIVTGLLVTPAMANEEEPSFVGFKMLESLPYPTEARTLVQTVLPFFDGVPDTGEAGGILDLSLRSLGDRYVVDIIITGQADHSVSGKHLRGVVVYRDAKKVWQLVKVGRKLICYRSKTTLGVCS